MGRKHGIYNNADDGTHRTKQRLNTVIIFHRQRVKQLLIVSWMPYKAISALQAPWLSALGQ